MARDAAWVEEAIELRETVMDGDPLEIVDENRNARDTLCFGEKAHNLWRLQMMQEETAGDDIDARIGKWKIERIARHEPRRSERWRQFAGLGGVLRGGPAA